MYFTSLTLPTTYNQPKLSSCVATGLHPGCEECAHHILITLHHRPWVEQGSAVTRDTPLTAHN